MLITSQCCLQKYSLVRTSIISCSQSTNSSSSLASILFPEPTPIEKPEATKPSNTPPEKPTTKQQAQAVVSSAADAAVNVLGVGWSALTAVSNRITGLTSSPSTPSTSIVNPQIQATVRIVTPESLHQRTISLIRSIKQASSTLSQATRIEDLSNYLLQNPDANYFTKKVRILKRNYQS